MEQVRMVVGKTCEPILIEFPNNNYIAYKALILPSMYIQYVDLVIGIYMIYLSLHCEFQLHYRASSRASCH